MRIALLFYLLLLVSTVSAQDARRERTRQADLMLGFGSGQTNLSVSYQAGWKFGEKKRLVMGVGLRSNAFFANEKYFETAPARLVKGEAGPGAFFNKKIPENMDSVFFPKANVYAINFLIHIGYSFTQKLTAGFNIDVIGASFGSSQNGLYINGDGPAPNAPFPVTGSPSSFNLLLVGENDLGSLNSEFFITYALNDKMAIKGGIQHIFMEYTTATEIQQSPEPNDRFRITPTVLCVGFVYSLR